MTGSLTPNLILVRTEKRLACVESIPQQDSAQNAFNKLARTFAAQVAALKGYRSKGEQKMTVQHVHVAEGGQAIVGNAGPEGRCAGARAPLECQRRWIRAQATSLDGARHREPTAPPPSLPAWRSYRWRAPFIHKRRQGKNLSRAEGRRAHGA